MPDDPPIPPIPPYLQTSWCYNGGTMTVTTPCEGMTIAECEALHDSLVAAAQAIFPPNC